MLGNCELLLLGFSATDLRIIYFSPLWDLRRGVRACRDTSSSKEPSSKPALLFEFPSGLFWIFFFFPSPASKLSTPVFTSSPDGEKMREMRGEANLDAKKRRPVIHLEQLSWDVPMERTQACPSSLSLLSGCGEPGCF